ncbi:hypothetical protein GGI10_003803, partial [Coemansia sp. RSA 2530]
FKKEALYEICKTQGIRWHEDASNRDARFKRNRLRQLINAKSSDPKSPFNVDSLLRVCDTMQGHREYINQEVGRHLASSAKFDASLGTVELAATVAPRVGEIEPCKALALGASVVWDKRLVVSVSWPRSQLVNLVTWSLYSLDDAMRLWRGPISEHRNRLKLARKRLEPHMVQVTQPVVCIRIAGAGEAQTYPVLALGHTIESAPDMAVAAGIDIDIRALGKLASANEIIR